MKSFTDGLAITLSLTIAGQTYTIPGGNVMSLELGLHPYGFSGELGFDVLLSSKQPTDTLLTPITQNDLIVVALQVEVYIKQSNAKSSSLKLSGLATSKGFSEETLEEYQQPILCRHYHLAFADPAQVLWKQHFPCDLVTDSTLQTLIAAHTSDKIKLQYNWDALSTKYPVLSLPLGASGNPASFYDFLLWLVDSQNGVFTYDLGNNQYTLSASKSKQGTPQPLNALEVANFGIEFPEIGRHQPNVLNAYSESPQTTAIENDQKASPMRRDYIARYPIASDMQARVSLETARFKLRKHEVRVEYHKFPLMITPPGQTVNFKDSLWSSSLFVQGKTYRVREWRLIAHSVKEKGSTPLPAHNVGYNSYLMEHSLLLECSDELWVDLPPYVLPVYPFFVEGKIVSEQGEDTDATYQFHQDQDTSVNYYQISIPLWGNKKVRAAYQPNLDTGQFYFPSYKNARVLVGLGFDSAYIATFLDWGSGTALPMDSQGNQLVMGKSTTSQNILKHTYVDGKPELLIQRTQDSDTELLQFSDGTIVLQTQQQEKGS